MGNLLKLADPPTSDVRLTLQEAIDMADELDSVIVIGLFKDNSQMLKTSTACRFKKMFLVQFLNAWASKLFRVDEDK